MDISDAIYSRLNDASITSIVSDRIFPTDPQRGTQWPFLVYRLTNSAPVTTMAGIAGITNFSFQVDIWTKSLTQSISLGNAISARLHCYRGGNITGSFLSEQNNQQLSDDTEGDIYYTVQVYNVWSGSASVTATTDSTGRIQTGSNSVSLSACSNVLTLDCTGLTLNGNQVGANPDLTPYARKDSNNNFTAGQSITGSVSATGTITAGLFAGPATNLTGIPAAQLTGTVADARLTANVALVNAANTFTAQQTLNATTAPQAIVKAQTGQTANLTEWQNSSGAAKIAINPTVPASGYDPYYISLKPGNREYKIGTWDAGGRMLFALTDQGITNGLTFKPASNCIEMSTLLGDMNVKSSLGSLFLAGNDNGGTTNIECGARYSDRHPGCGGHVRIWTCQGSSANALSVLAPGGGSTLSAIDKNGGFVPASMTDSTAQNNTIYYSTTANKLVYKDASGTVNNLY